jgi:hypothetical protein
LVSASGAEVGPWKSRQIFRGQISASARFLGRCIEESHSGLRHWRAEIVLGHRVLLNTIEKFHVLAPLRLFLWRRSEERAFSGRKDDGEKKIVEEMIFYSAFSFLFTIWFYP